MKKNIAVAICALSIGSSAAMADVKLQANSGQTLTTSTQSIPAGAVGSLAASPALVVAGVIVVGGILIKVIDDNNSGSH